MKRLSLLLAVGLTIFTLSCEKDNPTPPSAGNTDFTINFRTTYDGTPIVANQETYTDIGNETFSVSLMMYYISHIRLVKSDGTEVNAGNYDLINPFGGDEFSFAKVSLPNGNYTKLKFYLGIPQPQNGIASSEGDLNVALGMAWTWTFGYIFFKHEGTFSNTTAGITNKGISHHLGTNAALGTAEMPLNITLDGNAKTITVDLDLKKVYNNPANLFVDGSSRHSGTDDKTWIPMMSAQICNAFSIK